jgi:predicted NUDIX family phosphoesterase
MYTVDKIKAVKYDWDNQWTVTADLRGLETFTDFQSNYDIVEKLEENKVLLKDTEEDSEYCQFFAYFKTKDEADKFIQRLTDYVNERKQMLQSLGIGSGFYKP